jgi:hypothetical protein
MNKRLVWDRLPMTIVFMSVLSAVLEEWAGLRGWRWPLIGFGLASVLWWQFSGDLKVYVLVQFGPALVLVPAAMTDSRMRGIWKSGAAYVAAKIFEIFDAQIYNAIGFSGHSLKHLAAALAAYWILQWMVRSFNRVQAVELRPVTIKQWTSTFSGTRSRSRAHRRDATSIDS